MCTSIDGDVSPRLVAVLALASFAANCVSTPTSHHANKTVSQRWSVKRGTQRGAKMNKRNHRTTKYTQRGASAWKLLAYCCIVFLTHLLACPHLAAAPVEPGRERALFVLGWAGDHCSRHASKISSGAARDGPAPTGLVKCTYNARTEERLRTLLWWARGQPDNPVLSRKIPFLEMTF